MHDPQTNATAKQRGTVYILALGVTAMLMVLGVGGLMLARSVADRHGSKADQARAAVLAESYLDVVHHRIDHSTTWRSEHLNDTWTSPGETLDGGLLQYKLVDTLDGSLNNEPTDRVRVYSRATLGDAVRIYSVELTCYDGLTLERDWATLRREANE